MIFCSLNSQLNGISLHELIKNQTFALLEKCVENMSIQLTSALQTVMQMCGHLWGRGGKGDW